MAEFHVKLMPFTGRATVAADAATPVTVETHKRAQCPYPPGNVTITMAPTGDLTCSYSKRSRMTPGLVSQAAGDCAEDGEGSVTVEVLIDGAVIHTSPDLPLSGSVVYEMAQRVIDDPEPTKGVSFRITPVNGSLAGTERTTAPVVMLPEP